MRKAQNCTLLYGLRKKSIEVTGSFDEEEVGLNIKGTCQVNPNRTFPKVGGPKTLHGVATVQTVFMTNGGWVPDTSTL